MSSGTRESAIDRSRASRSLCPLQRKDRGRGRAGRGPQTPSDRDARTRPAPGGYVSGHVPVGHDEPPADDVPCDALALNVEKSFSRFLPPHCSHVCRVLLSDFSRNSVTCPQVAHRYSNNGIVILPFVCSEAPARAGAPLLDGFPRYISRGATSILRGRTALLQSLGGCMRLMRSSLPRASSRR